jgi:hypothetical protein
MNGFFASRTLPAKRTAEVTVERAWHRFFRPERLAHLPGNSVSETAQARAQSFARPQKFLGPKTNSATTRITVKWRGGTILPSLNTLDE